MRIHQGCVEIKIELDYDDYYLEIIVRNGLNACLVEYEIEVWKINKDYSLKKRIYRNIQNWGYNIDIKKIMDYLDIQLKGVK